jgi:glyoxylase I family protein
MFRGNDQLRSLEAGKDSAAMAKEKKGCVKGFHHVAIRVQDFDATVRFYREGLGLKERLAWGEGIKRAMMLDTGSGDCIEVFANGSEAPGEGRIVHISLRTDDCEAALKRAEAAGATVTMQAKNVEIPAKTGPAPVRIGFCKAPGGEIIEFFESA